MIGRDAARRYRRVMLDRWSGAFDWDDGNRAKCQKRGVSLAEIEAVFAGTPLIVPDPTHSIAELRLIAVRVDQRPRPVFVAFTLRDVRGVLVRPVSARYMHREEVDYYAETLARLADR